MPSAPPGAKTSPAPVDTSCDFELSNVCGYTQDKTDSFDWQRSSGKTSSVMTGPTNDHTYGTPVGECGSCILVKEIQG